MLTLPIRSESVRKTQRQVQEEPSHPLKGAINKRMALFSNLAKHSPTQRPPRRHEQDVYVPAPHEATV